MLYAFSRVPLREEPTSCDNHVTPYLLPLNDQCRKVVNIIDVAVGDVQRILVVGHGIAIASNFPFNMKSCLFNYPQLKNTIVHSNIEFGGY